MAFKIGSFLNAIIGTVVNLVSLIKGKAKVTDILVELMATLPKAILDAIAFGQITTVEQLDDALLALDARTGTEIGAWDVIRSLPQDKEEKFFDAFRDMIEILGKNKLKVPEYYQEAA
jgi:hypothetical protein